ncbi:MAG: hypothetical protein V4511_09705 [Bacteroidota bacterium]
MKTITFILTLFLFTGQLSFAQTYSSIISDKEIYSFLNSLIKSDKDRISKQLFRKISVNPKISKHWDSTNFFRPKTTEDFQKILTNDVDYIFWGKEIDSLLNENDRKFMLEQYKKFKDTVWHQPFTGTRLESKKQKKTDRYYFSIPIFSVDKQVVIIYFSNYCGDLCGFGGYYIYKKTVTNKWKFFTARGHWMS